MHQHRAHRILKCDNQLKSGVRCDERAQRIRRHHYTVYFIQWRNGIKRSIRARTNRSSLHRPGIVGCCRSNRKQLCLEIRAKCQLEDEKVISGLKDRFNSKPVCDSEKSIGVCEEKNITQGSSVIERIATASCQKSRSFLFQYNII